MARSLGFRSGDFAAVAFGRGPVRSESLTVPLVGDDIDEEATHRVPMRIGSRAV
jgi:hypothetical protein